MMGLLYYNYAGGKRHNHILNYRNFEKLLYLQQGVYLDCSQTMDTLSWQLLRSIHHKLNHLVLSQIPVGRQSLNYTLLFLE
uniref:Uncharacterized protein n=1 Tax=Arundo donax TaxID=35708 RepID=A0A0A9GLM6_ARUDO